MNNLEPVNSRKDLIAFPNFKVKKLDKERECFWRRIQTSVKGAQVSMRTIEKVHYMQMKKVIDNLFYEN